MKVEFLGHQGDVYIYQLDKFPKGKRTTNKQTNSGILAYGEATGHAHQFLRKDLASVKIFKIAEKPYENLLFLDVKKDSKLIHGRSSEFKGTEPDQKYHKPVMFQPGKYMIGIVQETDWIQKTSRKVVD